MQTLIYIIWGAIPAFFFLLALWHSLQKDTWSSCMKKEEVKDLFKQCGFVTICVVITYLVYSKIYAIYLSSTLKDYIPDFVAQILLLPVILYLGAVIFGPTKQIRISEPPNLKRKNKNAR